MSERSPSSSPSASVRRGPSADPSLPLLRSVQQHVVEGPHLRLDAPHPAAPRPSSVPVVAIATEPAVITGSTLWRRFSEPISTAVIATDSAAAPGGEQPSACTVETRPGPSASAASTSTLPDLDCPQCGKTFHNTSNRNRHMRLHRALRPFSCAYCPHTDSDSSNLNRHQRNCSAAAARFDSQLPSGSVVPVDQRLLPYDQGPRAMRLPPPAPTSVALMPVAPGPIPSSLPAPGPIPSSLPAPGPSPSSLPAPGPSPSSLPAPGPSPSSLSAEYAGHRHLDQWPRDRQPAPSLTHPHWRPYPAQVAAPWQYTGPHAPYVPWNQSPLPAYPAYPAYPTYYARPSSIVPLAAGPSSALPAYHPASFGMSLQWYPSLPYPYSWPFGALSATAPDPPSATPPDPPPGTPCSSAAESHP